MTRRELLLSGSSAALLCAQNPRVRIGIATTCYRAARRPKDTIGFLEFVHAAGGGGIQASLSSLDPVYLTRLRRRAEELNMYVEVMVDLPHADTTPFERTVQAAKYAGALCMRAACLSGRRYETFDSLGQWKEFVARSHDSLRQAARIVEKRRIPIAVENHKDWTADELESLMKQYGSDYLGVCLDTGNNIALLDDPMEVVERLAPYAFSTHIKDMAVDAYPDGFLLSEVPVGEGILDMKRIAAGVQRARPKTRLTLEMITRNPLPVPCLTDRYWATFPGNRRSCLERTMRMVKERRSDLPRLDGLDDDAQHKLEDSNVTRSLRYFGNG